MKINAYVLAGDPAWLELSVQSYYEWVDRIVVSFDQDFTSWTGTALPVEECLERLRLIDIKGKLDFQGGHYARLEHHPLENDTFQRQRALDAASQGADWVLQLDTDEILLDPASFTEALVEAEARGFGGLDYPARTFFQCVGEGRYLELSRAWWRSSAGYPGPVAIRSGSSLTHCRQSAQAHVFRVDFAARCTDAAQRGASVHRLVTPAQGIAHMSWVREPDIMYRKSRWSGHAGQREWDREMKMWSWASTRPRQAIIRSIIQPISVHRYWLRTARLSSIPQGTDLNGRSPALSGPAGPAHPART